MSRKSRSRLAADWFARLRLNATTQEVEHEDVVAEKEASEAAEAKAITDAAAVEAVRLADVAQAASDLAASEAAMDALALKTANDMIAAKEASDAARVALELKTTNDILSAKQAADAAMVAAKVIADAELATAVAGATMASTDILTSIKTVDGSGSGLDADLLDGKQASQFALAHSHPYLPTSGKAADANLLDGVNGASYLRSDATDYLNATLYVRGDIRNETGYRDHGVYGHYDSYKTNHIWSMGSSYRNSSSGANFGSLYGLAYKHTNNSTGGTMGGGHQMVWCNGGTPRASMGYDRLWHATSGNTWGSSNDGSGSGLDADLLDGLQLHTGRNNNANKVVRTDGNGYLQTGWINTTSGATTTGTLFTCFNSTSDKYLRYMTATNTRSKLSVYSKAESDARRTVNTDTNTWRSISNSVTSGSTSVSASSYAARTAYNKAVAATSTASKATNGYWKCKATGLIIQWGKYGSYGSNYYSGNRTITFPTAFPSVCVNVNMSIQSSYTRAMSPVYFSVKSWGRSNFSMPYYPQGFTWIAIGY